MGDKTLPMSDAETLFAGNRALTSSPHGRLPDGPDPTGVHGHGVSTGCSQSNGPSISLMATHVLSFINETKVPEEGLLGIKIEGQLEQDS